MISARKCFAALAGAAVISSMGACSGQESAVTSSRSSTPPTTTTAAPVQTDGTLPAGTDAYGYRDSFARCKDPERLVLLVGQTTGRPVTTVQGTRAGGDQRFVVCEDRTGTRVMRASAPGLRPDPFEGTFFTLPPTASSSWPTV
ncbi:hypothetical protein JK358_15740 [Nocardia sp. 2]|uniref:Lipoprotein n=1 Tax=Nocardia acididurans TaxID=2802282 RepID=A0ABS1M9L3_9NOCA|nr:hypothetical protein [Nocardia acididurans]MBL1075848.1 hypothetical protein [Nocardia acididurans]